MLFTPEKSNARAPSRNPWKLSPRPTRIQYVNRTRRATATLVSFLVFLVFLVIFQSTLLLSRSSKHNRPWLSPQHTNTTTITPNAAFQPPEPDAYRAPDSTDAFANYKYRNTCNISSLDLHLPFSPLCADRRSMLNAMSSGGRIGHDAPYMPRSCDMRWFTSEEICEILGRFEKVLIMGDSMMRHVVGSINVLLRKDLGYGAVTDWNFSEQERKDCFCNFQFNVKACSIQGIFRTADVVKNDPESLSCPAGTVDVMIEQMIRFPIPAEELDRFKDQLPDTKPQKPYAFIFGHGLWNDLDLQATLDWLDSILDSAIMKAPWLVEPRKPSRHRRASDAELLKSETLARSIDIEHQAVLWPRLFMTPNAAGKAKPDEWLVSQGNKALIMFEESVKEQVARRGVEHLGTWNMSIQSNKFDGVHLDLRGNMIKAMMIMNWLNMIEVEKF